MSSAVDPEPVRVLHVDDDPSVLDLAATFLEREGERLAVETATSAGEGLDRLGDDDADGGSGTRIDCIVSDYNMPKMDGLEFLEAVREDHPDLPFILFTGKGSEEIASEAITAGVTDYLNKGSGTDRYTLLANRIENTASQYRTERELRRSTERLRKLYGGLTDAIFVLDSNWEFTHLNSRAEEILQQSEAELIGEDVWDQFSAAVGTTFEEQYEKAMNQRISVTFEEFYPPLGVWVEVRAIPTEDGLTIHFHDISERKERERTIQRQNERLRTIVENAPVVLFGLDDEGVFTLSEGKGLAGLGLESGELVGQSAFDVYADTPIADGIERALDGETVNAPAAVGDRVYETWYRPIENGGETDDRVIGVAVDVTEQKEQERRYDAIFNQTFQFTGLMEPDGTLIEANETARRFGGVEPEDVIGEYIWDSYWWEISTEAQERVREAVSRAVEGEFVRYEEEIKSAEDSAIIDFSIKPVTDEGGEVVLLIPEGRDITERKEQERELERQAELLERTQQIANVGGWELDPLDEDLQWTDETRRIHEVPLDYEPDLEESIDFYHPEDSQVIEAAVERAIEAGEDFDEEVRLITANGEQRWVRAWGEPRREDGETVLVRGVIQDITERKRTESELRDEQMLVDTVLDTLDDVFYVVGTSGEFVRWNDRLNEVTGYTDEEIRAMDVLDFVPEADHERAAAALSEAFEEGEASLTADIHTKSGESVPHEFRGSRLIDTDGETVGMCGIARDITERAEREYRFDAVFNNAFQFMGLLQPDGTIVEINDTVLGFSGSDRAEIVGRPFWELPPLELSEGTAGRVKTAVERAAEGEFARFEEELGAGDDTRTIDTSITPVTTEDGEIEYLVAEGRDVSDLKERERELREERAFVESVFDAIPDVLYAFDEERTMLQWNDQLSAVTGYSDAEIDEMAPLDLVADEDMEQLQQTSARVFGEGAVATNQVDMVTKAGESIPMEVTAAPITDGDGTTVGLVGTGRDITERKQRERELEGERDRFSALFENIPDPSVSVELRNGEPITQSVNAAFEDVFGYAPETVIDESLKELIVPSDQENGTTELARKTGQGELLTKEVCRQTADGERRDFLFRNVPIEQSEIPEAFGIYTDITERRKNETYRRRLYEITADTELATDETIQRVLELGCEYFDMESGFLTHIEDDTQRIVRANSPHEAIQPGSECPLSEAYCRKTIEMDEPMTVAHAAASGWEDDPAYDRFGLEAYVGARLMIDGERYGTVCFADRSPHETEFSELERSFVDLLVRGVESTLERHKYETELERQNEQLGEFAGVISHDLRNPLTVADGYLELASETGDDEYFTKVENAHDRMDAIIEDVLTLARQGERIAETSRVPLAAVAEEAWENVAAVDAKLVIAEDLGKVDADESRLTQLFENLYRNAVEHAGEDIAVRVGRDPAGFYVEDDGPGIPEREREKVFDSGYTTGEEGTGMGLSIVDTIATAHGWGIGVGDGIDGGTRFKIQLGMTRGGSDDLLPTD